MMHTVVQNSTNCLAGWYFEEEEIKKSLSNGHMLNPSIDLTNACNLNCPYCFIEEKQSPRKIRRSNELSLSESLRIIDDLKSCGAQTINLVGAGEPTIDPHFKDIIEHIYSNNMKTVLFTNGIQFFHEKTLLDFIYTRDVDVVLKYNSISNEIQDLVAGRKGYSNKRNTVLNNLIQSGFNESLPTRLGLDMIVFKGNYQEVPKIHRYCRSNNIFPIAGEFIPTGRTEDGKFQGFSALTNWGIEEKSKIEQILKPICDDERKILLNKLQEIDHEFGVERNSCSAYFGGGICTQIIGIYIDIQGDIWPCVAKKQKISNSYKQLSLGNIRNGDSLSEIWREHPYLKTLRKNFNGGCPYKAPL